MASRLLLIAVLAPVSCVTGSAQDRLSPEEVRAVAKEATIYGFPLVDSYRIQFSYFVDGKNREYKGGWNEIHSTARVFGPEDRTIQTPNSDTPYSVMGADLSLEPLVLTFPPIEKGRYFSAQFIDGYTFNFAYVGTRTTGNDGGTVLLAGPGWTGPVPDGVNAVLRCETDIALVIYRTQLFGPEDLENVRKIQSGYTVRTLSQVLGTQTPVKIGAIGFWPPLSAPEERTSLKFFDVLSWLLKRCPVHASEQALRARFDRLGIGIGGQGFHPSSPVLLGAAEAGMHDAWQELESLQRQAATGEKKPVIGFGSREELKNNYLLRMLGAVQGIFGNSKEEAMYPAYFVDSTGQKLDGSKHPYLLHFGPADLPPVNAFWSLTLYDLPARGLVENPLHRYLINSPMLPQLKRDADGGLTLLVQHDSPGDDQASNWLPAPAGPFFLVLRLYWPKPEALDHRWRPPPLLQT
jgi:hypothetical protein